MNLGIEAEIKAFTSIYSEKVLATRTRRIELLGRKCDPQIIKGFLGYELKLQRRRITCPDMVTARYLRVFAKLGAAAIEIPYNPAETASIVPELEDQLQRIEQLTQEGADSPEIRRERATRLFRRIRARLKAIELQD